MYNSQGLGGRAGGRGESDEQISVGTGVGNRMGIWSNAEEDPRLLYMF